MVSRRAKETKKRKLSSARATASKGGTFERTSLTVPQGCEFFKPKKAGVYRLDIIPYEVGEGNPNAEPGMVHYERTYYVHRGVGANNESYVCPRKTSGKKCPICEHRAKLLRDPDADEDLVRSLAPKTRQLFNVIDKENTDKGVQVWDESYHLFGRHLDKKIKEADEDDQERYDNFHDPEKGMMLRVGASEESGAGYTYYDCSNIEFKDRKQQYDEDIIDSAHNLDEMVRELSYAELRKAFLQEDEEETEDEDEDTESGEDEDEDELPPKLRGKKTSSSSSKLPKKSGKKKDEEEEDANDEEEDLEEELDEDEDADEDESGDEDEGEAEEDAEFEVGALVSFEYRGSKHTGKVLRVRNGLVHVKCKDRSDPYIVDPDDCSPAKKEKEEAKPKKKVEKAAAKPPKKTSKKPPKDEDEEEDDEDEELDDTEDDEDEEEDEDD